MRSEPRRGRREGPVTERRAKVAGAAGIRTLVDAHDPEAERIVLVQDNRNPRSPASLDAAVPPAEAKRLAERLGLHPPPKHGSRLTMAAIEPSLWRRRCLARRLPDRATLVHEVAAWVAARNAAAAAVAWRFTTADARIKRKHRDPVPQPVESAVPAHQWAGHADLLGGQVRKEMLRFAQIDDRAPTQKPVMLSRSEESLSDSVRQARQHGQTTSASPGAGRGGW
jgi:hypothetical protein